MTKLIFFDFETSGLPDWHTPSGGEHQPHIVSCAAQLIEEDTRQMIAAMDLIARADGWTIDPEAEKAHGISVERTLEVGIDEAVIVDLLWRMWQLADIRVAHNESFDARIMRIALKRYRDDNTADLWKAGAAKCTARMASPIMKMAPTPKMLAAGRRHPKTPKLEEAYEYFVGKPLQDAHNAMADVIGCKQVYFAIQEFQGSPVSADRADKATTKPDVASARPEPSTGDLDAF